jgi:tRNA threonylcarbamoyladenosine biosynthesis protein TsaE
MLLKEKQFTLLLKNPEATQALGRYLGEVAMSGDVICLEGDLGAGKTTLTQAIAFGLEVPEARYVTSPSFAIFHEYPGRIPLYHMDFYRLHSASEIADLGLDEYFSLSGLTVIEWPVRAAGLLPPDRLLLEIANPGDDSRVIHCTCTERWENRIVNMFRVHPGFIPAEV